MENFHYFSPPFLMLKEDASKYLLKNGYRLYSEENNRVIFVNDANIFILLLNQRYDGTEVWIRNQSNEEYIRLDFILEYYLTGETELVNKYKKRRICNLETDTFEFYSEFLRNHLREIIESKLFSIEFNNWSKSNSDQIRKIAKEIN